VRERHAERPLSVQLLASELELIDEQKGNRGNIERVLSNVLDLFERNVAHQPASTGDALEIV
jgi:hypothetical protein